MKQLLLAGVGLAVVAVTSATAADAPRGRSLPPPRAPAYVPFFTWNGFYVGVNGGYGFGKSRWTDNVTQRSTGDFNINGALLGGTIGYNLQLSAYVVGLEGDFDWSNIKGSTTTTCIATCQTTNSWLGTARGRFGYAFDRFLPYLTAGAAFGDVKGSVVGFGNFKENRVGWTAGVGIEYAFIDHWSAKLEYLYADLGQATCNATCSGGNPFSVTFQTSIVRAGLNYKF